MQLPTSTMMKVRYQADYAKGVLVLRSGHDHDTRIRAPRMAFLVPCNRGEVGASGSGPHPIIGANLPGSPVPDSPNGHELHDARRAK
jgi:hypothetical protein